jgi:L-lysine 2,3-aminomutase
MDSLVNINIEPYYIYMHDLVPGSEFFRTTLKSALELEELLRGSTSGYNIPNFVVDLLAVVGNAIFGHIDTMISNQVYLFFAHL